jgi:hypothetical protein
MAKFDAFVRDGKRYDREGFRVLLRQQMQAARDDPAHPYNDSKHPQHAAAVADMRNGYRWLAGEVGEAEEVEIAGAVNAAIRGESEMPTNEKPEIQAVREMNRLASTPEGKEALMRARTGQSLTPQQAQLWEVYRELEAGVNAVARKEQHSPGGWMKTTRPHTVAPELYALEKIQDPRERVHAIRALKSQWRDDPKSAYNDTAHGDHKNAIEWMSRLYQAEADLGPQQEDEK